MAFRRRARTPPAAAPLPAAEPAATIPLDYPVRPRSRYGWGAPPHPQLEARGFFEELDHPVCGRQNVAGLPFRFASVDRWLHRPAPTMAEHDHEVVGAELGLSDDELARLTSAGIIGTAPSGL